MPGNKRKLPPSDSSELTGTRKRACRSEQASSQVIVVEDDEDDDLGAILARIQEQEASEALARQLQDEWNGPPAASTSTSASTNGVQNHGTTSEDPIVIEEDEVMAKRLAAEWGLEEQEPMEPSFPNGKTDSTKLSVSIPDEDIPPSEKLLSFRDLFTAERNCTKCRKLVPSPRGHVMFSSTTLPPSLLALLHAPCPSCKTNHCRGCFRPIACAPSCKGPTSKPNQTCHVQSCCAEGRAIALFEALGGFDRQYLGERATSESRALANMAKRKSTGAKSVGPGGTGYGTDSRGGWGGGWRGRGRGRGRGGGVANASIKRSQADELAAHWEELIVRALNILTELLPAPYADDAKTYDMLPHASIGPLLSLSQLPELLGSLLRNDSVTDWITRSETYHAMISLLRRMADCELTVQVLIGQRWEVAKSCGLDEWMWGDGVIIWEEEGEGKIARAPPLYEHFKKLTKQCEAFLAGASQMMDVDEGEDGGDVEETMVRATSLCGDIIAARDDMERAMTVLGKMSASNDDNLEFSDSNSKAKGKARDPSIDMEKTYSRACERLAFKHVMLGEEKTTGRGKGKNKETGSGLVYSSYNYSSSLTQTESSTRNPKDRLHLIKELAVMATSLPPGVWVRVDEIRNDAIKIMIAGPDDTPYAGGLFEFDCFMPIEYPNTPPLMHLRTTGGGKVRFNPNLYSNGKVCLSLLGTWPGQPEEQWSPKSTLLQVLVSIQSMILIDAPYFNEPGHGQANVKAPVSIAYNREVSLQTVRWAMVEWLKDEHQQGIWADVIASHFSIRKAQIRKRIVEWAQNDPRIRAYHLNSTKATEGYGGGMVSGFPASYEEYGVIGPTGGRRKPAPTSALTTVDLIQEYDQGIQRVREWGIGSEI